jgi:hypothetical protein
VRGEEVPLALNPPVDDVTVYPVIVAPPLFVGATKDTIAWALPPTAVGAAGAFGTVAGVTELDWVLETELPILFVATTVNVYAVPFVNPSTVRGEEAPLAVNPPVDDVTVYPVIDVPPVFVGGTKDTTACALPATAVASVGAFGFVKIVANEKSAIDMLDRPDKRYVFPAIKGRTIVSEVFFDINKFDNSFSVVPSISVRTISWPVGLNCLLL